MTPFTSLAAAVIAGLLLTACSGAGGPDVSPQQREALSEDMLEPDTLSGGYMTSIGRY